MKRDLFNYLIEYLGDHPFSVSLSSMLIGILAFFINIDITFIKDLAQIFMFFSAGLLSTLGIIGQLNIYFKKKKNERNIRNMER